MTAPDNLNDRPECGTYGCRGIGHIKGPKFATHNSASGCPYSPQNLHKVRQTSDRLNLKPENCDLDEESSEKSKVDKTDKIKMDKSEKFEKVEKTEKMEKLSTSEERLSKTEKEIKQDEGESDKNDKSENSER